MGILTLESLAGAIAERLRIPRESAASQAEQVLDLFGFESQVIDNLLEPEERQMFYLLQAHGLLTTRSEETLLWNGQEWRTHYWLLRADRIEAASGAFVDDEAAYEEAEVDAVYTALPDGAWKR